MLLSARLMAEGHFKPRPERGCRSCSGSVMTATLDVQDSIEAHEELPAAALSSFRRARALAAVLGAIDDVDAAAATDVIYETLASSSKEAEVLAALREVVDERMAPW